MIDVIVVTLVWVFPPLLIAILLWRAYRSRSEP